MTLRRASGWSNRDRLVQVRSPMKRLSRFSDPLLFTSITSSTDLTEERGDSRRLLASPVQIIIHLPGSFVFCYNIFHSYFHPHSNNFNTPTMTSIPPLEFTPLDVIPGVVERVSNSFLSHKTRPLEWRLLQLRKLYWAYVLHLRV